MRTTMARCLALFVAAVLVVACYPSITIGPDGLPDGAVGQQYSEVITASGGDGIHGMYSSGTLPPGLALSFDHDAGTGLLSGTPTTAGSYAFNITAYGPQYNLGGSEGTRHYTVVIR
jgi:large repetitive protein